MNRNFCGLDIIVQPPIKTEVKRSWLERLTTRPFLKKTKTVITEVMDDGQILRFGSTLVMNQKTANRLSEATNAIP